MHTRSCAATEFDAMESIAASNDEADIHEATMPPVRRVKTKAARKMTITSPRSPTTDCPGGENSASVATTTKKSRRPIRPVDRQKMLPWLVEKLNKKEMPKNLWWVEMARVFAVKWPHAASHGFSSAEHARLFKAWAEHTGLYVEGDEDGDHKRWKSNFRCAIHSVPDIKEITQRDGRKGPNAARMYKILDEPQRKKKSKGCDKSEDTIEDSEGKGDDSDDSGVSIKSECLPLPVTVLEKGPDNNSSDTEESATPNIPNFQSLGVQVQPIHFSGCQVTVKEEPPHSPSTPFPPIPLQFFPLSFPTTSSAFSTSLPTTTTPATTTTTFPSFPTPSDNVPTPPTISEALMEDMVPVGIMTTTTTNSTTAARPLLENLSLGGGARERTPSGDSGAPASPSLEETLGRLLNGGGDGAAVVADVGVVEGSSALEEISVDEGIDIDPNSYYIIEDLEAAEVVSGSQLIGPLSWSGGEVYCNAVPVPAVTMEVVEDFTTLTSLNLPDEMETVVQL